MFVRMTFTGMDPSNVEAARARYDSDEVSGIIRKQKGYRFHYLLDSVDHPGKGVSLTAWDSREDAEAYERSGTYKELVGKFGSYYTEPPQLESYEVPE